MDWGGESGISRTICGSYREADQGGEAMPATLLTIGELMLFLAIWVAFVDIRNEFMLFILAAGLLLIGLSVVVE